MGCELSARINKKIREAVRRFAYGDVGVFKCFCTVIVILFVVKLPYSSSRNELLLLSIKTIVLSKKFARMT